MAPLIDKTAAFKFGISMINETRQGVALQVG